MIYVSFEMQGQLEQHASGERKDTKKDEARAITHF